MSTLSTESENDTNHSLKKNFIVVVILAILFIGVAFLFYQNKNTMNSISVTDFPEGWHSVSLNELEGTPDFHFRKADSTHGLEVQGDLNGDKNIDKVRLLQKNDRTECAVVATLIKGNELIHHFIYKSKEMCRENSSIFVTNADQDPNIKAFQFIVGSYESAASVYYFEKGKFVEITVSH